MTLDNFAGVFASSLTLDPRGTGGDITVNAGNLVIRGQSQISSITRGPAPAGNINVTAGTLLADGPPTGQRHSPASPPRRIRIKWSDDHPWKSRQYQCQRT